MRLIPIDVLSGKYIVNDCDWEKRVYEKTGMQFGDTFGRVTGELLHDHDDNVKSHRHYTINHNFWRLTLVITSDKETGLDTLAVSIKGNPSKTHFGGKNYRNLTQEEFVKVIDDLTNNFCLNIDEIRLTAPFEPSFTWVDPDGIRLNENSIKGRFVTNLTNSFKTVTNDKLDYMGVETVADNSYPKVYLPGVKFSERLNYLRFEKHYDKIYTFHRDSNIRTWGELFTEKGIAACYKDVLATLDNSIIYDPKIKPRKEYPQWLNDIIKNAGRADYWLNDFPHTATDKTRKKRLNNYRDVCFKFGGGLHRKLEQAIEKDANKFNKEKADKFRIVSNLMKGYNSELIKYTYLDESDLINSKEDSNGANDTDLINYNPIHPTNKLINQIEKRTCLCCGKDISMQRKQSKYCSAKYVGEKAAKKCRNTVSNKKHASKTKPTTTPQLTKSAIRKLPEKSTTQPSSRELVLNKIKEIRERIKANAGAG